MIRKPPAGWERTEGPAVTTVRTALDAARSSAKVVRRGGHVARGLFCWLFAILWGFAALVGGLLGGSLPTLVGAGAMAAFMAWGGARAFARAREDSS
jgi:hypothetical protein